MWGGYYDKAPFSLSLQKWPAQVSGKYTLVEGGQVWNGSSYVPSSSADSTSLKGVVQVSAGYRHVCFLMKQGTVKCSGNGGYGQLGNNSTGTVTGPVDVHASTKDAKPLSRIVQISAGEYHTCALTNVGEVKCWGYGSNGRLGNGGTSNQGVPVYVRLTSSSGPKLSHVVAISAGGGHTCALTSSGGVKCWGSGYRLGNNSTSNSSNPVDVHTSDTDTTPLSNIAQISAGENHTCAINTSKNAKCWGYNSSGQLGDGTATIHRTPVNVRTSTSDSSTLSGILEISAGYLHTCARSSIGNIKCWGYNGHGQLGDGTTADKNSPIFVHTSSTDSTNLKVRNSLAEYMCSTSGKCLLNDPRPKISGTASSPVFTVSNINVGDSISAFSDSTCATQKGSTTTVATGATSASVTLTESITSSGLYFKLRAATWYQTRCLGPIKPSKPVAPAAPTLVGGDRTLTVSWAEPTDTGGLAITGYDIRRKCPTTASTWTEHLDVWSSGTLSKRLNNLTNAVTCTVQVRAINAIGASEWSDSTDGTPTS